MSQTKTSVKSIDHAISVCLENNLTFAAYRLPNQKKRVMMVQKKSKTEEVINLSKITGLKGFVIAPFMLSEKNRMLLIQPDFYFSDGISEEEFEAVAGIKHPALNNTLPKPYEVSEEEYLQQIRNITNAIKQGKIHKAVLSRVKVVGNRYNENVSDIFSELCHKFPNAFVYAFKANGHFWMGATPEPFAFLKENRFQTSSVAGTKENIEKYRWIENWGNKEKQEQQYVSDHIDRVLKKAHWENTTHNGPYVKEAGNLLHLRTDFITNANAINGNIGELLKNLHPTPAICGYPTKKALEIITSIEKHDRQYYGGFLGPVGMENPMTLFVNLRCMQISENYLVLYSGGGITIDSNPEDEWYETEMKAGTLLSVIHDNPFEIA